MASVTATVSASPPPLLPPAALAPYLYVPVLAHACVRVCVWCWNVLACGRCFPLGCERVPTVSCLTPTAIASPSFPCSPSSPLLPCLAGVCTDENGNRFEGTWVDDEAQG